MPSRAYRRRQGTVSRVSFSIVAAVFLVLSTAFSVGLARQLHAMSFRRVVPKPITPKYLVLIVLDGTRPDSLALAAMPHLRALMSHGVVYDRAFTGILESETPSGHAAIATGSTPARDGLLGFNWVTNQNDEVRLFDPNLVMQGAIEHVMERAGAPTIASLFKARYPKAKVLAVSGHKYYAADPLGGPAADYIVFYNGTANNTQIPTAIPGHVPPRSVMQAPGFAEKPNSPLGVEDHLVMNFAEMAFTKLHQQVTLINEPEFDWPLGHLWGSPPSASKKLLVQFDQDLGRLENTYRKAHVLNKTLFVVTADHGMVRLHHKIPDGIIDAAVAGAGATALERSFSTGSYLWVQDSSTAQSVAQIIAHENNPYVQSIYYRITSNAGDAYVRAGGIKISPQVDSANQYLLNSFLGGNAPDVVTFAKEGTTFEIGGAGETWKGNHGGNSWESQHLPLIISGPGVARGRVSHFPARLEDIAPTVLTMMKAKPTDMQGTPMADAMIRPTAAEKKAQAALNRTLDPVVTALQSESQAELKGSR